MILFNLSALPWPPLSSSDKINYRHDPFTSICCFRNNLPPYSGHHLLAIQVPFKSSYVLSHVRLCDSTDCSLPGPSDHGFSRQEYWSGLPFPSPGDLPDPGTESEPSALAGGFFTTAPPGKPFFQITSNIFKFFLTTCSNWPIFQYSN